jgi:hypothetical protein
VIELTGGDAVLASCARADEATARASIAPDPGLVARPTRTK